MPRRPSQHAGQPADAQVQRVEGVQVPLAGAPRQPPLLAQRGDQADQVEAEPLAAPCHSRQVDARRPALAAPGAPAPRVDMLGHRHRRGAHLRSPRGCARRCRRPADTRRRDSPPPRGPPARSAPCAAGPRSAAAACAAASPARGPAGPARRRAAPTAGRSAAPSPTHVAAAPAAPRAARSPRAAPARGGSSRPGWPCAGRACSQYTPPAPISEH